MPKVISRSAFKILETVRTNRWVNLRGIITETRLSPNAAATIVNDLVKNGILLEHRIGKKQTYIRQFALNGTPQLVRALFLLIEEEKKQHFYQKYRSLAPVAEQIIRAFPTIKALIIYGSYAKGTETKESDVDMLIIGSVSNKERLREILITLNAEPSIKIESIADFKKRSIDPLHQETFRHHVLLYDAGLFVRGMLKAAATMHQNSI